MEKILLSKEAFNLLIVSLIDIEENQTAFLDSYFPLPTKTREAMDSMITNYIQRMNETFERISVVEFSQLDNFPFVVIGSHIMVQELESQSTYEFQLITPSKSSINIGDISIFSPIGIALLLKEKNSIVEYDAPGGKFCYKILSISLSTIL